jgi:hypothetical protein
MTSKLKSAVALGLAGALALGSASPTLSAPLPTATASIAAAAPDHVTDVRHRRAAGAAFAGIALGLIGAGIAASTYPRYYYDPYPYSGYYGPYAYAPGPYYGYRHRHWRGW